MRVLHICSDYFSNPIYRNLFKNLESNGIENIVYVPKRHKHTPKKDVVFIAERKYNLLHRLLFFVKEHIGYKEIVQKISISEITLIHSHNLFSGGYLAYRLSKDFDIPFIIAVRNTDVNVFFRFMFHLRFLGIKIMNSAQNVIFISHSYKKYTLMKYVPENIREKIEKRSSVIQNGIDNYFLNNIFYRKNFIWDKKNIKLIFVGTLNRNKNVSTIIKVAQVLSKNYNVSLTLVGRIKDPKFNNVDKKYPFVKYVPYCGKEYIIELLRQADIFIMPSFKETFGLVYVEAMSQGLPVIYSEGQGFDGNFPNGFVGYSVNPTKSNKISDSILKIYENYSKISSNCSNNVHSFNWNAISKEYIKIYESTTKKVNDLL